MKDYPNAVLEEFYDDVLNGSIVSRLAYCVDDKSKQRWLDHNYRGATLELVKTIVENNAEKYI